ncbi:MAG: phospholipase A [Gammaproteobacteria bacterium]|nr:phospholipase A [Gammaproteobacteria bacterium]
MREPLKTLAPAVVLALALMTAPAAPARDVNQADPAPDHELAGTATPATAQPESSDQDAGAATSIDGEQNQSPGSARRSRLEHRILHERELVMKEFALLPHRPNYVLLYSYADEPNLANWYYDEAPGHEELIIHLSLKYPVWIQKKATRNRFAVFAAYTQKAFWQAYNEPVSRPFRETNHEPELLGYFFPDLKIGNWALPLVTLGINHHSNGQSGDLSRSWNRAYLDFVFARHDYAISIKPWYRFPESLANDDNPDILDYMGRGELTLAYGNGVVNLGLMFRNNLKSKGDNKGAGQLDFSYPVTENRKLSLYLQLFHGYGESLVDYNHVNTRIGIGVLTSNWL